MNFRNLTSSDAKLILTKGSVKSEELIRLTLVELLLLKVLDVSVERKPPLPKSPILIDYHYLSKGESFENQTIRKQYHIFMEYFLIGLSHIRMDLWASHISKTHNGFFFYKKERMKVLTERKIFESAGWGNHKLTSLGSELRLEIKNGFAELEKLFQQAVAEKISPLIEQIISVGTKIALYEHYGLKQMIEIRQFAMSQVHSGSVPDELSFYYDKLLIKKLIHTVDKINLYFSSHQEV